MSATNATTISDEQKRARRIATAKKVFAHIFACMIWFGLIWTVVAMFLSVASFSGAPTAKSFDQPYRSLLGVSYALSIIGIIIMATATSLRSNGKKFIKPLHIAGVVAAGVGSVLILVFGFLSLPAFSNAEVAAELAVGLVASVVLAFSWGIIACLGGGLYLIKAFDPIITAKVVLPDLQYLSLGRFKKLMYKLQLFFLSIPPWIGNLVITIGRKLKKLGLAIANNFVDLYQTFAHGSWQTRVSGVIMGFGSVTRKQIGRGILFFLFEVVFIVYMILTGGHWLSKFGSLGTLEPEKIWNEKWQTWTTIYHDDSFKILLYGLITIVFIVAFIYTWRLNMKQNRILDEIVRSGKKIKSTKDDLQSLIDNEFHKTLLALPLLGIFLFTVLPIIFMILVAFTSYDGAHDGYTNLFHWVGWDNFNILLSTQEGGFAVTFGEVLLWTLMWAFFATFTTYFLGMFVAIMINKKGIVIKKFWRTVLVLTIAIPQFISLLYVSQLFAQDGLINATLQKWGWIDKPIPFWTDINGHWPRATVILINIWIGIPYLMLMTTGILMNIPADLYESAKIDGANVFQQYVKITLPYVLFVTGPYLLTSFIGNINNFNVIYLLTGGGPAYTSVGGTAVGKTDLLITWLFNLTQGAEANYKLSAVIGILIFIVVAGISLIVYNVMPSTRNEEDYS